MSTTRKTPSRNPAASAPGPRPAVFDLDSLERDGEVVEPFRAVVGGEEFVFGDVEDVDWQDAVALRVDQPQELLRSLLGEDFDRFAEKRMPLWKLNALCEALDQHYGWSAKLGAVGEDNASPTS